MDQNTLTSTYGGAEAMAQRSVLPPSADSAHHSCKETQLLILGISPGNSYYSKNENLLNLFQFATKHATHVKLFLPDVISVHSFRAIWSSNPERTSRVRSNYLMNRCKSLIKNHGPSLSSSEFTYVDWRKEVETSSEYTQQLEYIMTLFQTNEQFRKETLEVTDAALKSLLEWKKGVMKQTRLEGTTLVSEDLDRKANKVVHSSNLERNMEESAWNEDRDYDVFEGVNYILKEFAFFLSIPKAYSGFDKYAFLYHKRWPTLENLFKGVYDKNFHTCVEYISLEPERKDLD